MWVKGHSRSFKLVPFESLGAVSYSPSIVTMALSCIIRETLVANRDFFNTPFTFDAPVREVPVGILSSRLVWKNRMVALPDGEKILRICTTV